MKFRAAYLWLYLLLKAVAHDALVEVKQSIDSVSDNPVLMKILRSVEAATSDEHLFDVTLKLLTGICACMHDVLIARQDVHDIKNSKQDKDTSKEADSEWKEFDLYKRIYNNTCYSLRQGLNKKINFTSSNTTEDAEVFWNTTSCGHRNEIPAHKAIPKNASIHTILQDDEKLRLKSILFKALIQTKNYHQYNLKRYSLFGKAKSSIASHSKHSIIVILTLHPTQNKTENTTTAKTIQINERQLNNTLYTNSPIDIDMYDSKYDPEEKQSEERPKSDEISECTRLSIYKFLTESERHNLIKVFKLLRTKGTMKIYMEVETAKNHTDYSSICCDKDELFIPCSLDFITKNGESKEYYTDEAIGEERFRKYKKTIARIKELVKLYSKNLQEDKRENHVSSQKLIYYEPRSKYKFINKNNSDLTDIYEVTSYKTINNEITEMSSSVYKSATETRIKSEKDTKGNFDSSLMGSITSNSSYNQNDTVFHKTWQNTISEEVVSKPDQRVNKKPIIDWNKQNTVASSKELKSKKTVSTPSNNSTKSTKAKKQPKYFFLSKEVLMNNEFDIKLVYSAPTSKSINVNVSNNIPKDHYSKQNNVLNITLSNNKKSTITATAINELMIIAETTPTIPTLKTTNLEKFLVTKPKFTEPEDFKDHSSFTNSIYILRTSESNNSSKIISKTSIVGKQLDQTKLQTSLNASDSLDNGREIRFEMIKPHFVKNSTINHLDKYDKVILKTFREIKNAEPFSVATIERPFSVDTTERNILLSIFLKDNQINSEEAVFQPNITVGVTHAYTYIESKTIPLQRSVYLTKQPISNDQLKLMKIPSSRLHLPQTTTKAGLGQDVSINVDIVPQTNEIDYLREPFISNSMSLKNKRKVSIETNAEQIQAMTELEMHHDSSTIAMEATKNMKAMEPETISVINIGIGQTESNSVRIFDPYKENTLSNIKSQDSNEIESLKENRNVTKNGVLSLTTYATLFKDAVTNNLIQSHSAESEETSLTKDTKQIEVTTETKEKLGNREKWQPTKLSASSLTNHLENEIAETYDTTSMLQIKELSDSTKSKLDDLNIISQIGIKSPNVKTRYYELSKNTETTQIVSINGTDKYITMLNIPLPIKITNKTNLDLVSDSETIQTKHLNEDSPLITSNSSLNKLTNYAQYKLENGLDDKIENPYTEISTTSSAINMSQIGVTTNTENVPESINDIEMQLKAINISTLTGVITKLVTKTNIANNKKYYTLGEERHSAESDTSFTNIDMLRLHVPSFQRQSTDIGTTHFVTNMPHFKVTAKTETIQSEFKNEVKTHPSKLAVPLSKANAPLIDFLPTRIKKESTNATKNHSAYLDEPLLPIKMPHQDTLANKITKKPTKTTGNNSLNFGVLPSPTDILYFDLTTSTEASTNERQPSKFDVPPATTQTSHVEVPMLVIKSRSVTTDPIKQQAGVMNRTFYTTNIPDVPETTHLVFLKEKVNHSLKFDTQLAQTTKIPHIEITYSTKSNPEASSNLENPPTKIDKSYSVTNSERIEITMNKENTHLKSTNDIGINSLWFSKLVNPNSKMPHLEVNYSIRSETTDKIKQQVQNISHFASKLEHLSITPSTETKHPVHTNKKEMYSPWFDTQLAQKTHIPHVEVLPRTTHRTKSNEEASDNASSKSQEINKTDFVTNLKHFTIQIKSTYGIERHSKDSNEQSLTTYSPHLQVTANTEPKVTESTKELDHSTNSPTPTTNMHYYNDKNYTEIKFRIEETSQNESTNDDEKHTEQNATLLTSNTPKVEVMDNIDAKQSVLTNEVENHTFKLDVRYLTTKMPHLKLVTTTELFKTKAENEGNINGDISEIDAPPLRVNTLQLEKFCENVTIKSKSTNDLRKNSSKFDIAAVPPHKLYFEITTYMEAIQTRTTNEFEKRLSELDVQHPSKSVPHLEMMAEIIDIEKHESDELHSSTNIPLNIDTPTESLRLGSTNTVEQNSPMFIPKLTMLTYKPHAVVKKYSPKPESSDKVAKLILELSTPFFITTMAQPSSHLQTLKTPETKQPQSSIKEDKTRSAMLNRPPPATNKPLLHIATKTKSKTKYSDNVERFSTNTDETIFSRIIQNEDISYTKKTDSEFTYEKERESEKSDTPPRTTKLSYLKLLNLYNTENILETITEIINPQVEIRSRNVIISKNITNGKEMALDSQEKAQISRENNNYDTNKSINIENDQACTTEMNKIQIIRYSKSNNFTKPYEKMRAVFEETTNPTIVDKSTAVKKSIFSKQVSDSITPKYTLKMISTDFKLPIIRRVTSNLLSAVKSDLNMLNGSEILQSIPTDSTSSQVTAIIDKSEPIATESKTYGTKIPFCENLESKDSYSIHPVGSLRTKTNDNFTTTPENTMKNHQVYLSKQPVKKHTNEDKSKWKNSKQKSTTKTSKNPLSTNKRDIVIQSIAGDLELSTADIDYQASTRIEVRATSIPSTKSINDQTKTKTIDKNVPVPSKFGGATKTPEVRASLTHSSSSYRISDLKDKKYIMDTSIVDTTSETAMFNKFQHEINDTHNLNQGSTTSISSESFDKMRFILHKTISRKTFQNFTSVADMRNKMTTNVVAFKNLREDDHSFNTTSALEPESRRDIGILHDNVSFSTGTVDNTLDKEEEANITLALSLITFTENTIMTKSQPKVFLESLMFIGTKNKKKETIKSPQDSVSYLKKIGQKVVTTTKIANVDLTTDIDKKYEAESHRINKNLSTTIFNESKSQVEVKKRIQAKITKKNTEVTERTRLKNYVLGSSKSAADTKLSSKGLSSNDLRDNIPSKDKAHTVILNNEKVRKNTLSKSTFNEKQTYMNPAHAASAANILKQHIEKEKNSLKMYTKTTEMWKLNTSSNKKLKTRIVYNTYEPTLLEDLTIEVTSPKNKINKSEKFSLIARSTVKATENKPEPKPEFKIAKKIKSVDHFKTITVETVKTLNLLRSANGTNGKDIILHNSVHYNSQEHLHKSGPPNKKIRTGFFINTSLSKKSKPSVVIHNIRRNTTILPVKIKQKQNSLKLPIPLPKTKLYPGGKMPQLAQKQSIRRIHIGTNRKEIMTMNTVDFFSNRRYVTPRNVMKEIQGQNSRPLVIQKPKSRQVLLRPKFSRVDTYHYKPMVIHVSPKTMHIERRLDFYRPRFESHVHEMIQPSNHNEGQRTTSTNKPSLTIYKNPETGNQIYADVLNYEVNRVPYKRNEPSPSNRISHVIQDFESKSDSYRGSKSGLPLRKSYENDQDFDLNTFNILEPIFKKTSYENVIEKPLMPPKIKVVESEIDGNEMYYKPVIKSARPRESPKYFMDSLSVASEEADLARDPHRRRYWHQLDSSNRMVRFTTPRPARRSRRTIFFLSPTEKYDEYDI